MVHLKRGVVALLCAALLAACGSSQAGPHQFAAIAYGAFKPASITLTDTSGTPYDLASTPSTPLTLVFFGYTHCPDECPAVMSQVSSAFSRLTAAQAAKITMIFVTTDPSEDTGPVLRAWLDRYDPTFIGLTGKLAQITALATSVRLTVEGATRLPSGGWEPATHDTHVLALNAKHLTVATWDMGTTSKQYASDLQAMLNGSVPQ